VSDAKVSDEEAFDIKTPGAKIPGANTSGAKTPGDRVLGSNGRAATSTGGSAGTERSMATERSGATERSAATAGGAFLWIGANASTPGVVAVLNWRSFWKPLVCPSPCVDAGAVCAGGGSECKRVATKACSGGAN